MSGRLKLDPVLTDAERLVIDRRRCGITQENYALTQKVTVHDLWLMEKGRVPVKVKDKPIIGKLENHEWCVVMRLRAGLLQRDIAKKLGCSRYWINRMENGLSPSHTLVDFWRA